MPGWSSRADGLGLVLEPPQLVLAGQQPGLDHLQRHRAVEADLAGLVDDAHAAPAQLLPDLIVAEVADRGAAGQAVAIARSGAWDARQSRGPGLAKERGRAVIDRFTGFRPRRGRNGCVRIGRPAPAVTPTWHRSPRSRAPVARSGPGRR